MNTRRLPLPHPVRPSLAGLAALLLGTLACSGDLGPERVKAAVAPPLRLEGKAYDAAGLTTLEETAPLEFPGLHNVYRLSDDIVSGSEPHGEEAFAELQALGIRTIVSVDGKVPDAETAARYGLRYVHVPIQYKGMTGDELTAIAKTFRELDGPFYVHCFHGKHRGPAAAAVGRLVRDGASRGEALAEMRQWCGTSPEYEGLYAVIASAPIPEEGATAAFPFDFPAAHPLGGVRGAMIPVPRAHDHLKAQAQLGWALDPGHPDLDPVNEALILGGLFEALAELPETREQPEDFRGWVADAVAASRELAQALQPSRERRAAGQPLDGEERAAVDAAFGRLSATCKSCHAVYRNE